MQTFCLCVPCSINTHASIYCCFSLVPRYPHYFSCQSFAAYIGCESSPCLNGATCTQLTDSYQCTCPAGYTGTHCEQGIIFIVVFLDPLLGKKFSILPPTISLSVTFWLPNISNFVKKCESCSEIMSHFDLKQLFLWLSVDFVHEASGGGSVLNSFIYQH